MDSQTDVHSLLKDAQNRLVALEARAAELENNSKELDSKLASLGYDPAVHKFDDISIDPLTKYIKSDSTNKPKHVLSIEPVERAIGKKPKVVDPSLFPEIGRVVEGVDKNKDDDIENEEDDEDGDNKEEFEGVTVINNTMCMRCGGNGQTRMLMVKIPFFREIILMSFECDDCGEKNNEVQSGAAVQPKGCSYNLKLLNIDDFSRQIVKSEHATVRFEELDFEIPAEKGEMTNIEGLLRSAFDALSDSQPRRREIDEEAAKKVDEFLSKLEDALDGESFPMTMTLHDPSGNSFVENKLAPKTDPQLKVEYFKRSLEEHLKLGFQPEHYESENLMDKNIEFSASSAATLPPRHIKTGGKLEKEPLTTRSIVEKEVYMFPSPCPNCGDENQNAKMYVTDIPFFKEIVIMAFSCEECEYKSNEIKGAGSIPKFGQKITLKVRSMATNAKGFKEDMARDVIKSNSAGIIIPEIDVEVTQGSLGGMYTTVEGLLNTIKDSLFDGMADDLISGDSADSERKSKFRKLEDKFNNFIAGYESFTLILVDPLANSYVYNPYSPEADPMLTIEDYERTEEENDDLGLTQMKVDDYVDNPSDEEEVENTQVELNLNPDIIASVKNLQKDGAAAHPYANYTHSVEDKVEKQ